MFLTLLNQFESLQATTQNTKCKRFWGYCYHTDEHIYTLGTFCTAHLCPCVSLSHNTPASPVADPVTQVAQNYLQNAHCDLPSSTTPHSHPHTHTVTSFSQSLHKLLLVFSYWHSLHTFLTLPMLLISSHLWHRFIQDSYLSFFSWSVIQSHFSK